MSFAIFSEVPSGFFGSIGTVRRLAGLSRVIIIVHQYAMRRAFEVVELAALHCLQKDRDDADGDQRGEWDKQVNDFHGVRTREWFDVRQAAAH